jgi:fluoroacetyl-CoA thioesterase
MQKEDVIGAVGISQMSVRPGDTALAHGSGDMPILSSSFLLTLMESACNSAVAEFLDQGESTILQRIALEINESVGIGTEIQGSATCTNLEDNLILFVCEIHDGSRLIAFATMERLVIDRVSYLARSAAYSLISQQSDS